MNKSILKKDLDAEHYRNHSSYQYESAMALIEEHPFKETDNILDVGCGDGRITAELAKRVSLGKAIGLDLSESMIALAASSFTQESYPNLEFHVCNAEEIPYKNQFDVVLSANCLHWVPDKRKAFQGMLDALVPGGSLHILMGSKEGGFGDRMVEISNDERWKKYTSQATTPGSVTASDCRTLLEELGAAVHFCEVRERTAEFSGREDFKAFISIWIDYYLPLPDELREEYLNMVVDYVVEQSVDKEGGQIHLPFKGLVIKAIK